MIPVHERSSGPWDVHQQAGGGDYRAGKECRERHRRGASSVRKVGYEEKYDTLLRENKLLFTLDLIKEKLDEAYADTDEASMAEKMIDIMDICEATANPHLLWFRKLLDEHFEGIIAHATYQITSGKVEGINQKIKTLRRHGYGYPDDEYFFLKLFDASRTTYDRNPKYHRICD